MRRKSHLRRAWVRLIEARSFILACHSRPDPDTLGSALALAHVLRSLQKDVTVLAADGVPEHYAFIPESDTVVKSIDAHNCDIGILIDCGNVKRVGGAADTIESCKKIGCVDHHVPEGECGDITVIDHEMSSTAELVVELLDANKMEIDSIAASQLLAGLIGDTGAFRFANTTPHTFKIASRLTALGANPSMIARKIYENKDIREVRLLGKALDSMQTDDNGHIIWATITRSDFKELGLTDENTDGIVNQVGAVKGPKVALLMRELEDGKVRVSLRSKSEVDVNMIARVFGGGGHVAAAGCTINLPLDQARDALISEVLKWTG